MNTLKLRKITNKIQPSRTISTIVAAFGLFVMGITLWFLSPSLQATSNYVPIDNWIPTTSLPITVGSLNVIEHNNNLYLIGGRKSDGAPTSQVYRSRINADGSLSTWTTTSALPKPLYLHTASATDKHIYVIGGWKGSPPVQKIVYRAAFMANGELGPWVNVQRDYPTDGRPDRGIDLHGSVIVGNRIYGFGGRNGFNALDTVHSSVIGENGNLSAWRSETSLPNTLYRHAVTAHNGYVYVTGGFDQVAESLVYYAKVNSNGTLSAWQTTTPLPQAAYYHRVVIHDGKLLLIGGADDSTEFSAVYSATISGNGSIGSWAAEPSLPKSLYRFAAVSVDKYGSDYVYVIGGFSNNSVQSSVYHSAVPPTPTPTNTPTPIPTSTPTPTPTPPVSISATISTQPSHWVAEGEEITYTIEYENDGLLTVSNANINSVIPENTELVTSTVSSSPIANVMASSDGVEVSWNIGTLNPSENGSISYTVRRKPIPPPLQQDAVLEIEIMGPTAAEANVPITYTMVITNQAPALPNARARVTLPVGSTYIGSTDGATVDGNKLQWDLQTFAPYSTVSLGFAISAQQTIIIKDYGASAEVVTVQPPNNFTRSTEDRILITDINGTPPTEPGDGVIISNNGATLSWFYNGQLSSISLNTVENPTSRSFVQTNSIFLPLIEN